MIENPLIEIAEDFEYDADLVIDLPEAANRELRNARILRAAAAVILQMQALRSDIAERKIFWPAEVDFAIEALAAYEAACKERP